MHRSNSLPLRPNPSPSSPYQHKPHSLLSPTSSVHLKFTTIPHYPIITYILSQYSCLSLHNTFNNLCCFITNIFHYCPNIYNNPRWTYQCLNNLHSHWQPRLQYWNTTLWWTWKECLQINTWILYLVGYPF